MLPLNDYGVLGIHELEFKAAPPVNGKYTYYPGTTEIPEASLQEHLACRSRFLPKSMFTLKTHKA